MNFRDAITRMVQGRADGGMVIMRRKSWPDGVFLRNDALMKTGLNLRLYIRTGDVTRSMAFIATSSDLETDNWETS